MANPLTNKLGPLQTWQWLAIGGGGGLLLYLYERNKAPAAEPSNELAGSTNNPFTEGGGGGGEGAQPAPSPGLIGEPGPAGAPGEPGAPAPANGISEARLEAVESAIDRLNNPPTGSHTVAPQSKGGRFPLTNPANGLKYRVAHEKGKTVHVYANGHKVVVGKKSNTKAGHTAPSNHGRPKKLKAPKAKQPAHAPTRAPARAPAGKPAKKGKRR